MCVCVCVCARVRACVRAMKVLVLFTFAVKLLNVVWSHVDLVLMGNINEEFLINNHYGTLKRTNEA